MCGQGMYQPHRDRSICDRATADDCDYPSEESALQPVTFGFPLPQFSDHFLIGHVGNSLNGVHLRAPQLVDTAPLV